MILAILFSLSLVVIAVLGYVCFRLSRKLLQFDELFEMLVDEIGINTRYFDKLLQLPLFINSSEVQEANKNMNVMKIRLEEYVNQISDVTGKERPQKK